MPSLLGVFYHESVLEFYQIIFCVPLEMIIFFIFIFYSIDMMLYIN